MDEAAHDSAGAPLHDVVVLSDLHLGRGKNPETGRYFNLEAFFYDDDFRRLCRYLVDESARRNRPLRVIFNGDVFDLLRIEPPEAPPGATQRVRRYGPAIDPRTAAQMVAAILAGHTTFVDGVAHLLTSGVEVVFLPGNHDIELQWRPVQDEVTATLMAAVTRRSDEAGVALARGRLSFQPWFHYEPGRLWVEHGCQYDAENSFRFPLRSGLADDPRSADDAEADLPLGNFFQRYLYNAFGHMTFIVPSTRANFRYMKWMVANQPGLVLRVLARQAPFAWQLLRRQIRHKAAGREALRKAHEAELAELAERSGLGAALDAVDALKDVPHDLVQGMRAIGVHTLKLVTAAVLTTLLSAGLWFAAVATINELRSGLGYKMFLFLALNFVFLSVAAFATAYVFFRTPSGTPPTPLWRAARQISSLVNVPIVTFGHTHDEALWRLDRGAGGAAWYYNTGTWIAVFTHDELLPRERVQFTFLCVRDHEAELVQWSPGRNEPLPVILLDEETRWGPIHPSAAPAP